MKIRALVNTSEKLQPWLQWRITNPYAEMRKYGIDADTVWVTPGMPLDHDIDILVLPRICVNYESQSSTKAWFDDIKSRGTKLVYEADDDIWSESYVSDLTKVYTTQQFRDEPLDLIATLQVLEARRMANIWTLQQCDAVTVTTQVLAEYVRTLTEAPVYVVPNAIHIPSFERGLVPNYRHHSDVTIGWAGGMRTEADLTDMVKGWSLLAQAHKNVHFVLAGWTPQAIKDSIILKDRYTHIPWTTTDKYAQGMQVDIGCCAITEDSPFSQRKSPIKAWEYALAGAMTVVQGSVYKDEPYSLLCADGTTWYEMLRYFVERPFGIETMAELCKQDVLLNHDLKYQYCVWQRVYEDMLGITEEVEESEHAIV